MKGSTGNTAYGNYIIIDHHNGFKTLYAHLEKGIRLKIGENIGEGDYIGNMSDSGNAYGKHLHFEVIENNNRIDPTPYLDNSFTKKNKYSIGNKVKINGVYYTSISTDRLIPLINEGTITKIIENARNPYLLDNGKIGWVNDDAIIDLITDDRYLKNENYYGFSIVDALNQINVDSSYQYRTYLAEKNNIRNYQGTSEQNMYMVSLLKEGKLKY